MNPKGHTDPGAATTAATKLFTAGCGEQIAALAWPPLNNFG